MVFSIDIWALVCTSLPFLNHSIDGMGFPEIPSLSLTEVSALYLTTSVYSGGTSISGAP